MSMLGPLGTWGIVLDVEGWSNSAQQEIGPSRSLVSQRRWVRLLEYSSTLNGQEEHMVRHFHLTQVGQH